MPTAWLLASADVSWYTAGEKMDYNKQDAMYCQAASAASGLELYIKYQWEPRFQRAELHIHPTT